MPANSGMLFVYPGSQNLCFWMKDMHFSLDMLWLDPNRKIVKIQPDVTPGTFPRAYCATGKYVVELRAGQAAQHQLHIGQTVHF